MNTERYILPVVIAAGLHGALLLCFSAKYPPPLPGEVEISPVVPDPLRVEMTDPPEVEPGEAGAGKADPLPSLEDVPKPVNEEDIFRVEVTPSAPPLKPLLTLPKNPTGSIGPGDIGTDIGRVGIPNVRSLDRIPRAVVQSAPSYPATMRSSATNGSVTVEFVVDTTGRVVSAEAVKWTHHDFVDSAVRAVLRWRFEPGTLNGRKVSFRMAVPIEFHAAD